MKKARIILTCIAFLAVVGGAFAFNVLRNLRQAYTFTGGTTWISTTVGTKVYSTTIAHCVPISLAGQTAYISNVGVPAPGIYSTSASSTVFTSTTAGGLTISTTLPANTCNTAAPLANTLLTTVQ